MRFRRDDQLAAALMRDVARCAELVQALAPAHAQARFQAPGRIVDARVNDAGVARRRLLSGPLVSFEYECFQASLGERASNGQTDHARANDDDIR